MTPNVHHGNAAGKGDQADVTKHSYFPGTSNMTCITPWIKSDSFLQQYIAQWTNECLV